MVFLPCLAIETVIIFAHDDAGRRGHPRHHYGDSYSMAGAARGGDDTIVGGNGSSTKNAVEYNTLYGDFLFNDLLN